MGDWAQSPIPNPQSPIPYKFIILSKNKLYKNIKKRIINFIIKNSIK